MHIYIKCNDYAAASELARVFNATTPHLAIVDSPTIDVYGIRITYVHVPS